MAWRIPEETINALRDRVSIVEVVSNYVALKKAGRNYLGLCPFHSEKTPSFTVSDERGLFHCFGCGAGGSVFTFLMQHERLEFREAVELLAKRVGFQLPTPEVDERVVSERERLLRLNAWAAKRFREALWGRDGQGARQYLEKRGVSEEIAERFGLGYAPPAGDLLCGALAGRREAMNAAARLGLVSQRDEGGGGYDRFRGRLMFPIADTRSGIIAFGGRALGDVQPKYLNSPESTLFHKGEVLYALPQARDEIRKCDEAIVVEGYLDALALIQFGIANVVATLGTALTPAHLRVLGRLAKRVVCFFDGDNAGRRAALRGFAVCAEAGTWAHGAFLPDGEDPDSFVRKEGADAVRALLGQALPLTEFYFQQARAQAGPGMPERAQVAQETMRIIAAVQDPIERDLLLRTASARLGIGEDALRAALRRVPQRAAESSQSPPLSRPRALEPRAEVLLLETMVADEGIAKTVALRGVIERFDNPELAQAGREIVAAWEREGRAIPALDSLPVEVAARLREALIADDVEHDQRLQQAEDCLRRIEANFERPLLHAAKQELRDASDSGDIEKERDLVRRAQERTEARRQSKTTPG